MFLAFLAVGGISAVVAGGGKRGQSKDCDKDKGGPSADAARRHDQSKGASAGDSKSSSPSADAKRSHGQLQDGAAGDSNGGSPSADAKGRHGQLQDGAPRSKGVSNDMMPFVVLAAAAVVLTLTACVVIVSCRRCRAKDPRSLQSDAARLEQGEVGQDNATKGVVITGVPMDSNVVTGIPVEHGGASAAGEV